MSLFLDLSWISGPYFSASLLVSSEILSQLSGFVSPGPILEISVNCDGPRPTTVKPDERLQKKKSNSTFGEKMERDADGINRERLSLKI